MLHQLMYYSCDTCFTSENTIRIWILLAKRNTTIHARYMKEDCTFYCPQQQIASPIVKLLKSKHI